MSLTIQRTMLWVNQSLTSCSLIEPFFLTQCRILFLHFDQLISIDLTILSGSLSDSINALSKSSRVSTEYKTFWTDVVNDIDEAEANSTDAETFSNETEAFSSGTEAFSTVALLVSIEEYKFNIPK